MREKVRFMSQTVTLTGLGSVRFEGTVEALREIRRKGEQEFHQGQLQDWMPLKVQGHNTIELLNWYFHLRGNDYSGEDLMLSPDMDPKGILRRVAGDNMVHTEDNEVSYFRGIIENRKKR